MPALELRQLHRERIQRALMRMREHPASIITAPMGYGKTMAVMDYFRHSQEPYAWVALSEPVKVSGTDYFWFALLSTLREKAPALCSRLEAMGFPDDSLKTLRFLETLRAETLKSDFYVVFDDFQYANQPRINSLIAQVVQANVPRLHIVLLGREYPALPVTEWEMKGLCDVITAKTLAFTPEETEEYLRLIRFEAEPGVVESIAARSNGWIASIYLMANDYARFQSIDQSATIFSMLRSSLYDTYSEEEKKYLMLLSLFDRFTFEQVCDVFEKPELREFLSRLYAGNALLFRDSSGGYRFHDLFRRFLREELKAARLDVRPFAAQAAKWASEHSDYLHAFEFYMLAEDFDHILCELERAPVMEIFKMDKTVLKKLFAAPQDVMEKYPMALLKYIFFVCMEVDAAKGQALLEEFRSRCTALKHPQYTPDHLLAESYVLGTALMFNDLDKVIEAMDLSAKLLHGQKSVIRIRTSNLTYGSPHMTYAYYNAPGVYAHIVDDFAHRFESHILVADGNGFGADCVALAEYGLETGDLSRVEYNANKALFKAAQYDQTCIRICAYLALGRYYIAVGQKERARAVIESLSSMTEEITDSSKFFALDCAVGYLYATLGEYDSIPKWLCTGDFDSESSLQQRLAFNYIVFGKAVILKGDYMYLDFLTEMFEKNFASFHYQLGYLHNFLFKAICNQQLYGTEYALPAVQAALDIALQDQIVMPFVEYFAYLRPAFESPQLKMPAEYRKKLFSLAGAEAPQAEREEGGNEVLTGREMEIMQYLAQGRSNAQIAEALFISLNTVKRHIQNIYRKLGVSNKTTALLKFREMEGNAGGTF